MAHPRLPIVRKSSEMTEFEFLHVDSYQRSAAMGGKTKARRCWPMWTMVLSQFRPQLCAALAESWAHLTDVERCLAIPVKQSAGSAPRAESGPLRVTFPTAATRRNGEIMALSGVECVGY